jgi:hypothetical protein
MTDWTELLVLRDMQVDSLGQQKEDGKPVPHCWRSALPPHVSACRKRRLDARVAVMSDATRKRMDIREAMMVITGRICQYYIEVRPADLNEVTRSETIWEEGEAERI